MNNPIQNLCEDSLISEVLVNNYQDIYIEKKGELYKSEDNFLTQQNYHMYIHKLLKEANQNLDAEAPFCSFQFQNMRYQILHPVITQKDFSISIRKYRFESLKLSNFFTDTLSESIFNNILHNKQNFIVVGVTGSGKTSFINSCLQRLPQQERVLILEDTPELKPQSSACVTLYTRTAESSSLPSIDLSRLIKESLRLRPDRIVVGEVRGAEAKDLLLALSTGHRGSFGTLHAANSFEALMRLEMLIQLGAPQWSLETIRRMVYFGLQFIVTLTKSENGSRYVSQISKITCLESSGFLLEDLI